MYIQVEESNYKDKCPMCKSPDIKVIKIFSNGIVHITKYRCLTCLAMYDVCPDYDTW